MRHRIAPPSNRSREDEGEGMTSDVEQAEMDLREIARLSPGSHMHRQSIARLDRLRGVAAEMEAKQE